jgi:predicted nuclease of restriction endonuclease-like (RecB) superfamily
MIVEEEQGGKARAEYGKGLMRELAGYLSTRFKHGFSLSTLKNAKQFYNVYATTVIKNTLNPSTKKRQALISQFYPFKLSWSHYLVLMRIKNDDERRFYEIEAINQNWDYRWMRKQYASSLYERIALSANKDKVTRLASEGQIVEESHDLLKNPLVLDFLDLEENPEYSETELETSVIAQLQLFLSELGKGFLFEARQKRFTFNEKHYKLDLVCYNRLLRCYVLIDFKIDSLEHKDLGQMMMYVHYYDRNVKTEDERPTVGILLCKEKDDAVVELTLPEGENIYAAEYSLYLPDKSTLQSKLAEWIAEFEENQALLELANGGDGE